VWALTWLTCWGESMHRTEKLRPVTAVDHPGRANGPVFIAAALVAIGIAYVLLLAHPGLVHGVNAVWGRMPGAGSAPDWALPTFAAGVAIGGTAIGIALLSAFVRGVQSHPFSWLAPILIGFSTLVMTGIPIELPWPTLSVRLFTVFAGMTVLGGGAVMQMRGLWSIAAGTLLVLLPMLTLLAGYASMPGGLATVMPQLDSTAQLFLFVLALTSVGIGFMAIVTERSAQDAALLAHRFRNQRRHIVEALERARVGELRAVEAERRAQTAEQQLRAHGTSPWGAPPVSENEAAAFAALARPGISWTWMLAGAFVATVAVAAGLYFALHRPLERRAAALQGFASSTAKEHAAEIDGLRRHFQAQQANLQALLAAERAEAAAALAAAGEHARTEADAKAQADTIQPTRPVASTRNANAKAESRRASARKPAAVRRVQRKPAASSAVTRPASNTDSEPELSRETRRALREQVNDDPIGGLE
jgi:hypothetical protein